MIADHISTVAPHLVLSRVAIRPQLILPPYHVYQLPPCHVGCYFLLTCFSVPSLDPFAVTSGGVQFADSDADSDRAGWRYEDEAGPLTEEPVLLEWQIEGWVSDIDPAYGDEHEHDDAELIPFEDADAEEMADDTAQRWGAHAKPGELTLDEDLMYPGAGKSLCAYSSYANTSPHAPLSLPTLPTLSTIPTPASLSQLTHSSSPPSIANVHHPSLSSYIPSSPSSSQRYSRQSQSQSQQKGWDFTGMEDGGAGWYDPQRRSWLGA
ncbi:hypothetical protein NEOLEDRAFT_522993 [Neolentinus lepideus HHB14362 ss-1]|uniref:Uncharacterized protein n=1 Tax=Neolentinus lepideus HHB14362 ss-1 TaxID=1314782 RepID=A0A165RCM9_9AGAM|nr:hypothetical protein NEOLEDRAFT_522993 [Neolentinus lepideus HHB14362 ss-1]